MANYAASVGNFTIDYFVMRRPAALDGAATTAEIASHVSYPFTGSSGNPPMDCILNGIAMTVDVAPLARFSPPLVQSAFVVVTSTPQLVAPTTVARMFRYAPLLPAPPPAAPSGGVAAARCLSELVQSNRQRGSDPPACSWWQPFQPIVWLVILSAVIIMGNVMYWCAATAAAWHPRLWPVPTTRCCDGSPPRALQAGGRRQSGGFPSHRQPPAQRDAGHVPLAPGIRAERELLGRHTGRKGELDGVPQLRPPTCRFRGWAVVHAPAAHRRKTSSSAGHRLCSSASSSPSSCSPPPTCRTSLPSTPTLPSVRTLPPPPKTNPTRPNSEAPPAG